MRRSDYKKNTIFRDWLFIWWYFCNSEALLFLITLVFKLVRQLVFCFVRDYRGSDDWECHAPLWFCADNYLYPYFIWAFFFRNFIWILYRERFNNNFCKKKGLIITKWRSLLMIWPWCGLYIFFDDNFWFLMVISYYPFINSVLVIFVYVLLLFQSTFLIRVELYLSDWLYSVAIFCLCALLGNAGCWIESKFLCGLLVCHHHSSLQDRSV